MANFRNNNIKSDGVAFMVAHEDKNGVTYFKGTMDLGNGKAIKLMMFQNNNADQKSDWIINGYKKQYNAKPKAPRKTW